MGSEEGQQLFQGTWMSQEVSKRLGSVGYFPNTMVSLSLVVWVPFRFFDVHGLYGGLEEHGGATHFLGLRNLTWNLKMMVSKRNFLF